MIIEFLDHLDGAIARLKKSESKFGHYLGRVLKVGKMLENIRLTYLASIYDSSPLSTR